MKDETPPLCKCSRRDATYGSLVVMALLIILTFLREAPLIVIVADHKKADHFMMTQYHGGKPLPTSHGPPVDGGDASDNDEDKVVVSKKKAESSTASADKDKLKKRPYRVFTVATNISNPYFAYFSESARKAKIHVEILGEGDTLMQEIPLSATDKKNPKVKKAFSARNNFGRKLLYLHEACEALPNKDTLVFLVDSYDAIFAGADLVSGYEKAREMAVSLIAKGELPPDIIAGGEMNCWPDRNMTSLYPKYSSKQKMRYLNSGVVAGPASAFLKLFKNFPYTGTESSDQRYWVSAFIASQSEDSLPVIDVDYAGHLVATISKNSWPLLSFSSGKPQIKNLPGKPQIVHLPNNKDKVQQCLKTILSKGSTH